MAATWVSSNSRMRPALPSPRKVLTLCNMAAMIGASTPRAPALARAVRPKVKPRPMATLT